MLYGKVVDEENNNPNHAAVGCESANLQHKDGGSLPSATTQHRNVVSQNLKHSSNKRKRRKHTDEQITILVAAFEKNTHPKRAEREVIAADTGLDDAQIMHWFDYRRRKRPCIQAASYKEGPQKQEGGGQAAEEVIDLLDGEESDVQPPAQSKPQPGKDFSSAPAVCNLEPGNDHGSSGVEMTPMELTPPAHPVPDSVTNQQLDASSGKEQAGLRSEAGQDGAATMVQTDAPRKLDRGFIRPKIPKRQSVGKKEHDSVVTCPTVAAAGGSTELPHGAGASAAVSQGCDQTKKEADDSSRHVPGSSEWAEEHLASCSRRAAQLVAAVHRTGPLAPLPPLPLKRLSKQELAGVLAGCHLSIGELLEALEGAYSGDREVLRSVILDMATRKSFAAKEAKCNERSDALSDQDPDLLWRWELRSLQSLSKSLQPEYKKLKKSLQETATLLTALKGVSLAMGDVLSGKTSAKSKAEKALARLANMPTPAILSSPQESGTIMETATSKDQEAKQLQSAFNPSHGAVAAATVNVSPVQTGIEEDEIKDGDMKQVKQSHKEQKREAERERLRLEKVAVRKEKEEQREALKREREAQKAEKEAEKERQRLEKEKEREQRKLEKTGLVGFGSVRSIQKSRNAFTSFFKKTPAESLKPTVAQPATTPQTDSPLRVRTLDNAFSPRGEDPPRLSLDDRGAAEKIDRDLERRDTVEAVQAKFESLLRKWKSHPRHKHVRGLPPSWARRMAAQAQPLVYDDDDLACTMWRRKFLWFPAFIGDDGLGYPQPHWPPYYGSWTKRSAAIKPRRPFAKDPQLDYQAMEDEEWEPEPDGDNLSDEDVDEDDVGPEDSGNGDMGYIVPDGHMSDDEGLSDVQQDIDNLCVSEDDAISERRGDELMIRLEAALKKARQVGKPLVISRLPNADDTSSYSGCLVGDPSLLAALQPKVMSLEFKVEVPPPPTDLVAAKGNAKAGRPTSTQGRPVEIVPGLIAYLQAHPEIKSVAKIVERFCEQNADRKLVKKWVAEKVKEVAEWKAGCWQIRQVAPEKKNVDQATQPTPPSGSQPNSETAEDAPSIAGGVAGGMLKYLNKTNLEPSNSATEASKCQIESTYQMSKKINSLLDKRWRVLTDALVQPSTSYTDDSASRLFAILDQAENPESIPAYVLTAMVKTLKSSGATSVLREGCARALAKVIHLLSTSPRKAAPSPNKVWGESRSAPKAASLETFFAEPHLQSILLLCIQSSDMDLAKSAGLLLGSLVRVGLSHRLATSSSCAEKADEDVPVQEELSAGCSIAANVFRIDIAEAEEWKRTLTDEQSASPTLLSYKLLVLCYLAMEASGSADSLLGAPPMYERVLQRFLASASSPQRGTAKYGMAGLVNLLHWLLSSGKPFVGVDGGRIQQSCEPSPLAQLLKVVLLRTRDAEVAGLQKGSVADTPKALALEVARLVAEVQLKQKNPVAANEGKSKVEMDIRDELLARLLEMKDTADPVLQLASQRAWEALMLS